MKKQLVAALVAAVLLFVWQFLSWSLVNVHASEMKYTPNQDTLLSVLSQNLEEGQYFMPNVPPGTPPEAAQADMEKRMGTPWATVSYHKAMDMNMGMSMFRGFAADLVAAFLLTWLLMQFANLNMQRALLASWAVGGAAYLTIPYLNSVWFETRSIGYLIDTIVQWGLVGAWLGWWLPRGRTAA